MRKSAGEIMIYRVPGEERNDGSAGFERFDVCAVGSGKEDIVGNCGAGRSGRLEVGPFLVEMAFCSKNAWREMFFDGKCSDTGPCYEVAIADRVLPRRSAGSAATTVEILDKFGLGLISSDDCVDLGPLQCSGRKDWR